ncbi:MAG: response regulator receiver protein [candidate division NC10 bacterium]|nr:response regulator receiver protein [candidate division NC10 bacterium]
MEKRPSFWHRMVGERTAHLACVRAALCEQVRADNLVFHGLAGHLLLPGIAHVLRVRVIADLDYRIKAAREQQGLRPVEAMAYIEKVDKERRQWIRFLFDVEWDDPNLYDVILNLSRMSLGTACEMVARLTEQGEFKATADSQRALENLTLASRADVAMKVVAENGIVTISGETRWQPLNEVVEAVARQVDGVTEVRSEVVFIPSAPST